LLPACLRGTSSTARELYGAARLLEALPPLPRGALVRVVLDSKCAVATAAGGSVCVGTVDAARRIDAELERRGVEAAFEWTPRAELADVDAASRLAVLDSGNAALTDAARTFLYRWAFKGEPPDIDAFASEASAVAPAFGSRWPCRGSLGDGVSVLRSDARRLAAAASVAAPPRVWAFPPFGLARPAVAAAIQALDSAILLVVPFAPHLHHCLLKAKWRYTPGPRAVVLPSGEIRAPHYPLAAYASPACRLTYPSRSSLPSPQQVDPPCPARPPA
jgi:hypothetical protein